MDTVTNVIRSYTDFTEGTKTEVRESIIVWDYSNTDPEFGYWQACELTTHIEKFFQLFNIDILSGKRCLEIMPKQLKKKNLCHEIIKQASVQ